MKKLIIAFITIAFVAGFSTVSFAGIDGSSHDLGDDGLGTDQICVFCHVPHNPISGVTEAPLWNHAVTTQSFTFYDGTTGSATGISKLCLGCHDGVTNLDAFGGSSGTAGKDIDTVFSGTTANVGTDLQDDHPVMVNYPSDGTTGFHNSSGLTYAKVFGSGTGTIECGSCHEPHDTTYTPFLRASNTGSQICLDCHDK
jgi:predicted CXXCH cytochrome family protein